MKKTLLAVGVFDFFISALNVWIYFHHHGGLFQIVAAVICAAAGLFAIYTRKWCP